MTEPNPLRLTIGKTRRVTGHEVPDNLADLEPADILHHVTDYVVLVDTNAPPMTHTPLPWTAKNALFESFVIDVSVDGKSLFIVDAFPLLHHTLALLRRLPGNPTFDMDVGEGLGIDGRKAEPATEIYSMRVGCHLWEEDGGGQPFFESTMTTSQVMLSLAGLVSDVAGSISAAGISAHATLKNFPVDFSKR